MKLSSDAEIFLARLAKELRPLDAEEREAVLLELRGHFEERQRQGPAYLTAAIEHMGSPVVLARDFIEASAVAMRSPSPSPQMVYLPPVITNSNLPIEYRRGVPLLRFREMAGELRATYEAIGDKWWSVCVFLISGYTATGFLATLGSVVPEHTALPIWSISAIRLAITLVGWAAAYRCILGKDDEVWQLDLPAARFAIISAILLVLQSILPTMIGTALLRYGVMGVNPRTGLYLQLFVFTLTGLTAFASLRLQPWAVSLIAGKEISPLSSWQGTSGKSGALLIVWLLAVGPVYLLHLGLATMVLYVPADLTVHFGMLLAIADAAAAMASTLATALLNVLAYRWVVREPIPAARPFSTTRPSDAEIAETNLRFHRLLTERARRDAENGLENRMARSRLP